MLEFLSSHLPEVYAKVMSDPALWLCMTLLAYALGMWIYQKSGFKTIFTPLLVSIVILVSVLELTGTDYKTYINGGQHINFLLGPATVALAVPLYEQRLRLAKMWLPLTCGLLAGGTVAIGAAVLIAGALGASPETMISLAPKSVTVPIAMAVSDHLGGIPALTAALVGDHRCGGRAHRADAASPHRRKGRRHPRLFHGLGRPRRGHGHGLSDEPRHGRLFGPGHGPQWPLHGLCRPVPVALAALAF